MSLADVYKKLPALHSSWHSLKLEPKLRGQGPGALRNTQESKTLADLADEILSGESLPALMIVLGRLKAITDVAENGDWSSARHHELVRSNELGMLTRFDRHNAHRDQRDVLRLLPPSGRGRGLPARGGDG